MIDFDYWETAQTLPMKKKGKFKGKNYKKKNLALLKCYKIRRKNINQGNLGVLARYGGTGCSSRW
jgi:hypothetical protein